MQDPKTALVIDRVGQKSGVAVLFDLQSLHVHFGRLVEPRHPPTPYAKTDVLKRGSRFWWQNRRKVVS
jgi:hypothetical protein